MQVLKDVFVCARIARCVQCKECVAKASVLFSAHHQRSGGSKGLYQQNTETMYVICECERERE